MVDAAPLTFCCIPMDKYLMRMANLGHGGVLAEAAAGWLLHLSAQSSGRVGVDEGGQKLWVKQ